MKHTLLLVCLINLILPVLAQSGYPKPSNMTDVLFYIQHNRGHNTYIYALNRLEDGNINKKDPIEVYRELFDEDGKIKPLSVIQRNFAYGISTQVVDSDTYEASIVSLPSQKFFLHIKSHKGSYVETTVNNVKMRVERIFIQQKEGTSGLGTKVDHIIFYGKAGHRSVVEKLVIKD